MTKEFGAPCELAGVMLHDECFEALCAVEVETVPDLGCAGVEIVDRIEVLVFFVPAEERAPETDVDIWLGDSRYDLAREALVQERI